MPRYAILPLGGYLEVSNVKQGRLLLEQIAAAGLQVELVEIRCIAQYQVRASTVIKEEPCDEPTPSADQTVGGD